MGFGTNTLFFGFIMTFVLSVGSGGDFAPGAVGLAVGLNDPSVNAWDLITNQFISPEVLLGGALTAVVAGITGVGLTFLMPAFALGAIANFMLTPTTQISSLGMPAELQIFIYALYQIMIIATLYEYIGGRRL